MASTWSPASADGYLLPPVLHHDPEECSNAIAEASTYAVTPLADPTTPWSDLTVDLAVAVHPSYVENEGTDWQDDVATLVSQASAIYEGQLNIRLDLVHVRELQPGEIEAGYWTDGMAVLDDVAGLYQAEHADLDRDAVMLLLGKNVGDLAGLAMCFGGVLNPAEHGYFFVQSTDAMKTWGPTKYTFLESELREPVAKAVAHELGHLLAARHEHANCAQSLPAYDPDHPYSACTLMMPSVGVITSEISTHSRLVMRGWAEYAGV